MTKIKICGLSRECDIDFVNEAKPDYIGFVFAESKRQISCLKARQLKNMLDKSIQSVGVFVNEDIDNLLNAVNCGIIDLIQLHGQENEEYIGILKYKTTLPIIKAVSVTDRTDILKANSLPCEYLLLDNGGGGTGKTFNWDLTEYAKKPFFMAGGLTPYNLKDAVAKSSPFAVDLSSGVETNGFKDRLKIIEAVRRI